MAMPILHCPNDRVVSALSDDEPPMLPVRLDRLGLSTELLQGRAQVIMGSDVLRVALKRQAVLLDGGRQAALVEERIAPVVVHPGVQGAKLGGALELGVKEFFTKPALKTELIESVRQFAGKALEPTDVDPSEPLSAPESEAAISGDLAQTPISETLRRLSRDAASGVLTVTHRKDRKAFELRNGSPVAASASGGVEALEEFLTAEDTPRRVVVYAGELVRGFWSGRESIDGRITAASRHWELARISPVERNVMRVALVELLDDRVPPKAAINEAIEIAREFGGADSPRFVNGVLDEILKNVRPQGRVTD